MSQQWSVRIVGDRFDLEELLGRFRSPPATIARDEEGAFWLTSDKFDALGEASEVDARANQLLKLVNGIIRIGNPAAKPVTVECVEQRDERGVRRRFVCSVGTAVGRSRATGIATTGSLQAETSVMQSEATLRLASKDEKVEKVLRMLAAPQHTWELLYKVYEVVESEIGGQMADMAQVSKAELRRFTQTANSEPALKDAARHGHSNVPPPPQPMSLKEADGLVARLVTSWISQSVQSAGT